MFIRDQIIRGYITVLGLALAGTGTGLWVGNFYQKKALQSHKIASQEQQLLRTLQVDILYNRPAKQLSPYVQDPLVFHRESTLFLERVEQIQKLLTEQSSEKSLTLSGLQSQLDAYKPKVQVFANKAAKTAKQIQALTTVPEQSQIAEKLVIELAQSKEFADFIEFPDELAHFSQLAEQREEATEEALIKAELLKTQIILTGLGVSLLLSMWLALYTSRAIANPIRKVTNVAQQVTQEANFELRVPVETNDELSVLAQALNELVQRVKHLIAEQQEYTQLERAIQNAPFPIMVHAEDGTILQISSTWTELTGYTHQDIPTTKAWAQLAYGEGAARVLKQVMAKKYTLTSRWEEGEFTIRTKDGRQCLWQFSSAPLGPLPDGSRVVISMAVDMTQHRQAEIEREELLKKLSRVNKELEESNTQLQTTLSQLHTSQLQLIQHEKMSSLGNLVAGIAHEINNPLSFVGGNVEALKESFEDLTTYIALFEKTFPSSKQAIVQARENLDIEFLMSDIPKILNSMYLGCDRIHNISNSLRIFARNDNDTKLDTDLHTILDSTLLILKYRLQANEIRPAIETIRFYDTLQPVACLPSQLSQAFMNIFANAIDMFDELALSTSFKALISSPQKIKVCTHTADHQVELTISDNGKGIDQETCKLIFERQFTTKAVGKGTGLGLAISKQIIEEKHNGSLTVKSALGQGTEFIIRLPISKSIDPLP